MHTITPTNTLGFRESVAATDGIVLVDFTAAWCPPCRMVEPILDQLAAEHDDLTIMTVDVDAWCTPASSALAISAWSSASPAHRRIDPRFLV